GDTQRALRIGTAGNAIRLGQGRGIADGERDRTLAGGLGGSAGQQGRVLDQRAGGQPEGDRQRERHGQGGTRGDGLVTQQQRERADGGAAGGREGDRTGWRQGDGQHVGERNRTLDASGVAYHQAVSRPLAGSSVRDIHRLGEAEGAVVINNRQGQAGRH